MSCPMKRRPNRWEEKRSAVVKALFETGPLSPFQPIRPAVSAAPRHGSSFAVAARGPASRARPTSGDRVLDLGWGEGATSVFLAREFVDIDVVAVDAWVSRATLRSVVETAGVAHQVTVEQADVRYLPLSSTSSSALTPSSTSAPTFTCCPGCFASCGQEEGWGDDAGPEGRPLRRAPAPRRSPLLWAGRRRLGMPRTGGGATGSCPVY